MMSSGALIYTHNLSPRISYIADFLSSYYGVPFQLTSSDVKYMESNTLSRVNYSHRRLHANEIFMHPSALLTESFIHNVLVVCYDQENFGHDGTFPAFFKSEGDTGFDMFAAIFYLLSRYEEYLPHTKDSLGRYAHENAIAWKNNFLDLPLVNIWLEDLRKRFLDKDSSFGQMSSFQFIPTYDIDMAWSYRNKGLSRNTGGMIKDILTLRFGKARERWKVVKGETVDPFDAYEWMDEMHTRYGLSPLYFFLMAKKQGRYDKNIPVNDPDFIALVKRIANRYEAGIHPSWESNDNKEQMAIEKKLLETVVLKRVVKSRQHFIRFSLPDTFRNLLHAGIEEDYSMGYGSVNGFRASVATPYFWYDLPNEAPTKLRLFPFCFMDATSHYEEKKSPDDAFVEMQKYLDAIRGCNGTMVMIWHNSFLGTAPEFAGWREVYERFIQAVQAAAPLKSGSPDTRPQA